MAKGYPIGVHNVHVFLWERSDRRAVVKIDHAELMDEYLCTKTTASRLVRKLVEDDRVRQITKRNYRKGLFRVADPKDFPVSEPETDEPNPTEETQP